MSLSPVEYGVVCSNCGTNQKFVLQQSRFRVCTNCSYSVYSNGIGEAVKLHPPDEDFTLLKIGTTGSFYDTHFTIIGRVSLKLNNGHINLWHLNISGKNKNYYTFLAEGMFGYALVDFLALQWDKNKIDSVKPGKELIINKLAKKNNVTTISTCTISRFEGELPEMPLHFEYCKIFEVNYPSNKIAFALAFEKYNGFCSYGEKAKLDELNLKNTRIAIDTTIPLSAVAQSSSITCPSCSKPVVLHGKGLTNYVVCNSCNSYLKVDRNAVRNEFVLKPNEFLTCDLPIGSTGIIDGTVYTVIGYTLKYNKDDDAHWQEYHLLNPVNGFLFLSVYEGNWIKLKQIDYGAVSSKTTDSPKYNSVSYNLFSTYSATVVDAKGEFVFDIVRQKTACAEYIKPPYMLAQEKTSNSIDWYFGEHLSRRDLSKGFPDIKLRPKYGIGMVEPSDAIFNGKALHVAIACFVLITAAHLIMSIQMQNKEVLSMTLNCSDSISGKSIVSPPFVLEGDVKNIKYSLITDVSNSWFETDNVLVNEETDDSYEFSKGVEYYAGYSDGEHWTEGDQSDSWTIPSIKKGRYHLIITPFKEKGRYDVPYTVKITRDVPSLHNFIYACLFILAIPGLALLIANLRNRRRWEQSSYNPYSED